MSKLNDIETLLEQMGEDRRRQAEATRRIERLARRQRGALVGVACLAALVLVTLLRVQPRSEVPQAEAPLVAKQQRPATAADDRTTTVAEHEGYDKALHISATGGKAEPTVNGTPGGSPTVAPLPDTVGSREARPLLAITEPLEVPAAEAQSETPDTPAPNVALPYRHEPLVADTNYQTVIDLHTYAANERNTGGGSRLHFTAAVATSVMSSYGGGITKDAIAYEQNGMLSDGASYADITPLGSLSAQAGVAYTLTQSERMDAHVGLVISGQAQRGEITTRTVSYANGINEDGIVESITTDGRDYNTFGLYAGIPFVLDMRPRNGSTGWSLSLTPAHTLFAPRPIGSATGGGITLNPWKLTAGIGINLSHGVVRRVSLTANLLPTYTSRTLREVGIEVGF